MKKLTAVIAAMVLAASGAASADPPAMRSGTHAGAHANVHANPNAGAVLHSPVRNANGYNHVTTHGQPAKAHKGWSKGKHKGWTQRCGYRWKDGRRYHSCWRVRR